MIFIWIDNLKWPSAICLTSNICKSFKSWLNESIPPKIAKYSSIPIKSKINKLKNNIVILILPSESPFKIHAACADLEDGRVP